MSEKLEVPRHLGIIPDGNRRWAKKKRLPTIEGHRQGYRNVREIARHAMDKGVEFVSVYGFSTENWKRPPDEVAALMGLLKWVAKKESKSLDRENIRVRFAGREDGLDPEIVEALRDAEDRTRSNDRGQLVMCINYGGKAELVDAAKAIVDEGLGSDEIDEETIASRLYLPSIPDGDPGIPDLDMVLRPGGEQRGSGFMTWRADYAELMFSDKLWPDFTVEDFDASMEDFASRQRRFGE